MFGREVCFCCRAGYVFVLNFIFVYYSAMQMLRDWTAISLETILTVDSQIDEISSSTSIFVVIFINNIKIHETLMNWKCLLLLTTYILTFEVVYLNWRHNNIGTCDVVTLRGVIFIKLRYFDCARLKMEIFIWLCVVNAYTANSKTNNFH